MAEEEELKISLYADDILLSSILTLKERIKQFGYYSSYKVNVNKTEASGH